MKLSLHNIDVFYGNKIILKNLNHVFESGKINLIVGRAGCGKSTLLLSLSGFHKEFSGSIMLDDSHFEPDGNFSLAFQNPEQLFFHSDLGSEVCFGLLARGEEPAVAAERGKAWLTRWGLSPEIYWERSTYELSGGEKRRGALASCTVFTPPLIMLDEPLAGLDIQGQAALGGILNELSQSHCVVIVTHEPEVLLRENSNVLFLQDGSGDSYSGRAFFDLAKSDENFYPLPKWFLSSRRFSD
jgi:energy-coupling factor transporter ATP-binding protein EcfA2